MKKERKNLFWIGSSKEDLKKFPSEVREEVGYALYFAQQGEKHLHSKPLKGFLSANVIEIIENFNTDTYRVVYTVRFKNLVYILHAFQKKSTSGIKTPKRDINLINSGLKMVEAHFKLISQEMKDE